MAIKIIANGILIIILAIAQISFIGGLPGIAGDLNLALVVLIFILGFSGFGPAMFWAFGMGFLFEVFSFLPFGAYLFSLIATVIIANFLLNYFFTNRSVYSFLALSGFASAAYGLSVYYFARVAGSARQVLISAGANSSAEITDKNFLFSIPKQICLNILITVVIYYIIYFLGKSFRPVFLIKNKIR